MKSIRRHLRNILLRTFFAPKLKKSEAKKYRQQFEEFIKLAAKSQRRFRIRWEDRYLLTGDDKPSHSFDRHYIYHTAWAARKLNDIAPDIHTDISSSLYFSSIISAFIPVNFYDYRPASLILDNFSSQYADLMKLPFESGSIKSLSCMHVVEHIGLGRYGDPLNPDGDLFAMRELERVLTPGGFLLFVVPVGQPILSFNSHRVYSFDLIIEAFHKLDLVEFSLIPDEKKQPMQINADPVLVGSQNYACGCFLFRKP